MGFRRDDHAVRDAVHDGRRLYAREEQPCARRRALRLLPAAAAGRPRPRAVHPVLYSRHPRVRLGGLHLRRGVLGDQRAFEHHVGGPADLPVQDGDPGCRGSDPGAGHRRNHSLHHLPEAGGLAVPRGGRSRSGRRQAERNGPRQGRGHREARQIRRRPGARRGPQMRKEVWFGLSIMAAVVILVFVLMPPPSQMTNGHLGLLMLAMIVVGIMLGFPTAFTLMGMGVFFGWLAYHSVDPATAERRVLDLFVQRTYGVMSNDVLIAIPLFLFMGYLVERAQLIDRLFRSLHLATARIPGALAVATIVTCAIFATATGIVGAVVTLMGLLAFPAMLKAGYNVKVAAGAITAGGCLGILIPPSVLLIVYGAVAGVSVVQLYAGAFLPGFMLAGLYIGYIILLAKWKPQLMPPLAESERRVELPSFAQALSPRGRNALAGLWRAAIGGNAGVAKRTVLAQLFVTLVPALFIAALLGVTYRATTAPEVEASTAGLIEAGGLIAAPEPEREASTGLIGMQEPEESGINESPAESSKTAPQAGAAAAKTPATAESERLPVPIWLWITFAVGIAIIVLIYWL